MASNTPDSSQSSQGSLGIPATQAAPQEPLEQPDDIPLPPEVLDEELAEAAAAAEAAEAEAAESGRGEGEEEPVDPLAGSLDTQFYGPVQRALATEKDLLAATIISAVRGFNVIYDKGLVLNKKDQVKKDAWINVAGQAGVSGMYCSVLRWYIVRFYAMLMSIVDILFGVIASCQL